MRSFIVVALTLVSLPMALTHSISKSARCGPSFGLTCKGSKYGNCCSQYSYCGSADSYCGKGCQPGFGDCKGIVPSPSIQSTIKSSTQVPTFSTRTSSSNAPGSTQKVSTNARCGKDGAGATCLGTKWGSCCSQYSYCGSTTDYCGERCQLGFGNCNAVSSSSKQSTRSSSSISPSSSVVSSTTTTWTTGSAGLTVSVVTSSTSVKLSSTSSFILETVSSSATPSLTSSATPSLTSSSVGTPSPSVEPSSSSVKPSSSSIEIPSTSSSSFSAIPSPTPPVCVPTDQFCTIDTFTDCCSQCCYFATGDVQAGQCC